MKARGKSSSIVYEQILPLLSSRITFASLENSYIHCRQAPQGAHFAMLSETIAIAWSFEVSPEAIAFESAFLSAHNDNP